MTAPQGYYKKNKQAKIYATHRNVEAMRCQELEEKCSNFTYPLKVLGRLLNEKHQGIQYRICKMHAIPGQEESLLASTC